MNPQTNATHKDVGEMNAKEFDAALFAAFGLRPPRDPRQGAAYLVATAFVLASQAVTDRDLIEAFVINFLLGRGDQLPEFRQLLEKALGRPVGADEPKPFDADALREQQAERARAAFA